VALQRDLRHELRQQPVRLPTVSVVMPTFQRGPTLKRTLEALTATDYPSDLLELIVVNNGSTDSTADVVHRFPILRSVTQNHSGVSKARNHGATLATGEVLLFLDDDIIVAPDTIRRHMTVRGKYESYPDCIVSGRPEFPTEIRAALESWPLGRFRLWVEDCAQATVVAAPGPNGRIFPDSVPTQNLSIGAAFFRQLGGFDERFPSIGGEDHDLCIRARKAGAIVVLDSDIPVIHNDQHASLISICRRQERGAVGAVCIARKHPDLPAPPSLALNGPVRRGDPAQVVVRKLARAALSHPVSLALAHRVVALAERLRPRGGWPLEVLYRALLGLYVFRGIRRGLRLTAREPWDPALREI
jgi:GT2 family glycosyltransferase